MAHAVHHALRLGARKVVVVGSDVPDLDAAVVRRALAALDVYQV